ncbi:MAG: branched-chain amino acid ABC transporter permease [Alphaproteobacteria bacterium]
MSAVFFVLVYGLSYGMVLFIISVGLAVTLGLMRVVNMAHGAFAAIGGYLALAWMTAWGVPFPLAVLLATAAVALFSVPIERLIYTRLYGSGELDQVLLTIGLIFITIAGLNYFYGPNPMPSTLPSWLASNADLFVLQVQNYRIMLIVVGLALMLGLWLLFDRTGFGARLRAAVDNRSMAQAVGINVDRLFSATFALGSGLAAFGGAVGYQILPLEPQYPFKYLALFLVIVTIAGLGNIRTTALMAMVVGIIDTGVRFLYPAAGAFVVYLILIAILLWRYRGTFSGIRG